MSRTTRWSPACRPRHDRDRLLRLRSAQRPPSPSGIDGDDRRSTAPASQPAAQLPLRSPATVYPTTGDAPCGVAPYTGEFKKITAIDAKTVEFQLCNPDVAFLSKIAFSAFGDPGQRLPRRARRRTSPYLETPNGTGPYKLKSWEKGQRIVFEANPRLLGHQGPDPEPRVPLERPGRAAAGWSSRPARVDGIDNPGTDDIAAIKADTT